MATAPRNVVLVGPMGTGKTTIGKLLARELGYEFVDSDREIEARCGADIPWIFDVEGEGGFRDRETAVLSELVETPHTVIATGGGAVVRPENQAVMMRAGAIVYLHTSVDQQYERTRQDKRRPLLQQKDPRAVLQRLMNEREPIYRDIADIIIETDRHKPWAVAREIVKQLRELVHG